MVAIETRYANFEIGLAYRAFFSVSTVAVPIDNISI